MDDILIGADRIDAELIVRKVTQILQLGLFEFSKWASNCPQLPENIGGPQGDSTIIGSDAHPHVLGVLWNQAEDKLGFLYETKSRYLSAQYYQKSLDNSTS